MADGKKLDPLSSEFETEEQAASYDKWFHARIEAALTDPGEDVPHDEVMRRMDAIIEAAVQRRGETPSTDAYDPIISEFGSAEAEAEYDRWFHEKVQASLDDDSPDVPHDEAMALVKAAIRQAAKKRA